MSHAQDTTLDRWVPLAWTLYKSIVRVSSVTGVCVYLVAGWFLGAGYIGAMLAVGVTLAFCLTLGVPAAILGVLVAAMFRAITPAAGPGEWMGLGGGTGLAAAVAVFTLAGSIAPISQMTVTLFWATFLLASVLAGTRAGLLACRHVARSARSSDALKRAG